MKRFGAAVIGLCLLAAPAEARHHHRHHHHAIGHARCTAGGCAIQINDHRPRAWCGWFARQLVGRDPGPAYNLARNWARWGRPSGPGVGVMVVWSHHVGMITGRDANGNWIVKSGNDGHRVRERPRSVTRAIAFRAG